MNGRTKLLLLIPGLALMALLAFLLMTFVGSSPASAACTYSGSGDWTINNGEVCSQTSTTITVSGDLKVMNGGSLTLTNVRLEMAGAFDGQRTIDVQPGGTFKVLTSSMITATNPNYEYKFFIRPGATADIKESTIERCGYDNTADDNLGLRIESSAVTIHAAVFQNSYAGVYIKGSSPKIDNSTFQLDHFGILVSGALASPTIYDCDLVDNQDGILIYDSSPTVGNNDIGRNSDRGMSLLRSNSKITGNDIHNNSIGIFMQSSSPLVQDNTIRGGKAGIKGFFVNPTIKGNNMHDLVRNVIYLSNSGGSIEGNYLKGLDDIWSTTQGAYLVTSTTLVKGNTIYHMGWAAVALMAGSNATVIDNNIDYPEYGVYIQASTVDIRRNNISHPYYGLYVCGAKGTIRENIFSSGFFGMDISYVNETLIIESNTLKYFDRRAILLNGGSPLIRWNNFDSNRDGIRIIAAHPKLMYNNFTNNPTSLDAYEYSDVYAEGNHFMLGNYSINISRGKGTLVNNIVEFSNNWSVFINRSYARMIGNKISGNGQKGAYFLQSTGWLTNNTLSSSGTGLYSWKSTLTMDHNNISKDDVGVFIDLSQITFDGDIFSNCTVQAIMSQNSNITTKNIQMIDNEVGLYVFGGGIDVMDSYFDNNKIAIWFWQDHHATITGVHITHSRDKSIWVQDLVETIPMKDLLLVNNSGKFQISNTKVDMRTSTFIGNQRGIELDKARLTLAFCTLETTNASALSGYSSQLIIDNSTLDGNLYGIDVDNVTLFIEDSYISNSNESGIQLRNADLVVKNTRIVGNKDGILDLGGSSIDILNCNISSNQVFGLYTDGSSQIVSLRYTRKLINEDNAFQIKGKMTIEDGGQLYLLRSNLVFWSANPGDSGVNVKPGGTLVMRENVLSAFYKDIGYYFKAEPGSSIEVSNASIRHCGLGLTGAASGLDIQTNKAKLNDLFFENNQVGLYVSGTSIEAHRLRFHNNTNGMRVDNGEILLEGSNFNMSSDKDIILLSSTARLVDTKVTYIKCNIIDEGSLLIVMWYLKITVVWNDGQPVRDASVSVADMAGTVLISSTDAQGETPRLIVKEYQQQGPQLTGYLALTPETITVKVNGLTVEKSQYVGASMEMKITMLDDKPPVVKVTNPVPGVILYSGKLLVIGTAFDEGSAVSMVELSLDGKNWFEANGTEFWSGYLTVPDGNHVLQVRATDTRGNSVTVTVDIEVDLTSPLLQIYDPRDGNITNKTTVTILGKVHQGARLLINDQEVSVNYNGTFSFVFILKEGENKITAKCFGRENGTMTQDLVIIRDTIAPQITLMNPQANALLNTSTITVTVKANEEASFYVNGYAVSTFGGKADASVVLEEGKNTITVKAVDRAGNSRTYIFNVTLDITKPSLLLNKPPSTVFRTTNDRLLFNGTTEQGANLTLNGKSVTLGPGGSFNVKNKLKLGKNSFILTSKDKAGNTNTIIVEVTRKKVTDYTLYYALFTLSVILGIVGDVGSVIYFKKYYRPKGPTTKGSKARLNPEDAEQEELEQGLEGKDGWERPRQEQRRKPRIPPPQRQAAAEETEFEEVRDLGEF